MRRADFEAGFRAALKLAPPRLVPAQPPRVWFSHYNGPIGRKGTVRNVDEGSMVERDPAPEIEAAWQAHAASQENQRLKPYIIQCDVNGAACRRETLVIGRDDADAEAQFVQLGGKAETVNAGDGYRRKHTCAACR